MKVLEVLRTVDPSYGGPTESVKQIGALLQKRHGVEIEILTLDDPASPHVEKYPFKVHALGPSKGVFGYSGKFAPWLKQHSKDYDLVSLHGIWSYNGYGAYRGMRGSKTPYVLFPHGMLDPYFSQSALKQAKKMAYWNLFERQTIKGAAEILFTCEEERKLAQGWVGRIAQGQRVVTYGTAAPTFDLEECKRDFLSRFPRLQGKHIMLYLGRIDSKKGIDMLIQSIGKFAKSRPDVAWVIAGPDKVGLQTALEDTAQALGVTDSIVWPGMVTGELKWGAYASADVFILPSHQENFGIVIAEAMACGKPVLTTDKVNIWREIVASKAAIVEPDTQEGIDNLFQRWFSLTQPEQIKLGENAKECFETRFEASRVAQGYYEVYDQVIRAATDTHRGKLVLAEQRSA